MGQGSSRDTGSSSERQRPRSTLWPRSTSHVSDHSSAPESQPRPHSRPHSFNPLGLQPPVISGRPLSGVDGGIVRRRSRLTRARSSLTTSMPNIFRRHSTRPSLSTADPLLSPTTRSSSPSRPSPRHAASDGPSYFLPRIQMPDLSLDIDDLTPTPEPSEPAARSSSRRASLRSASNLSDRISSLRPDRGIRNLSSSLRRRRSPLRPGEDQAAMLSRLLSVAAAATAATLMGGDHRAVSQARSVAGDEEDGTFDSFLQSLQNGRIASALRQNGSERYNESDVGGRREAPINLFRMFRFGASAPQRNEGTPQSASAPNNSNGNGASGARNSEGEGTDGRMVPIIIVGIRSITPGSGRVEDDSIPPFLDALSTFPAPLDSPSETNLNNFLRQPHNGTRFSHRRRASMGGLSTFPSGYDSQRHSRTTDRPRPWSTISDTPSGPRPPPSTPATPGLSAFSSGTTTPTTAQPSMSPGVQSSASSRRESFLRRPAGTGLGSTAEEPQTQSRPARQRRLSESDFARFGSGSSRRNGVVGPDSPDESSSEGGTRSWIIYVLGGSYPENHPILTTPSLFTDSPTYEDMLLLSSLLGPAKPPVATEDDVASAPGLFRVRRIEERLVAVAVDNDEIVPILSDERCLVCLSDFELEEEARRLVKCGHLFHRECIDQWLTTGRNSCPLCRGQGVDEKAADSSTTPDGSPPQPQQEVA